MTHPVEYIKITRERRREYIVECVMSDGSIEHDGVYRQQVQAEKRAEKLAKLCNCDWECNY